MLNKNVLQNQCFKLGTPEIDLFGSQVSHQLPKYAAQNPNPHITATDALPVLCSQKDYYVFQPFWLIPCVLSLISHKQEHSVILITSCWQAKVWFPKILNMLVARPVLIKISLRLLINPARRSTEGDQLSLQHQGLLVYITWTSLLHDLDFVKISLQQTANSQDFTIQKWNGTME